MSTSNELKPNGQIKKVKDCKSCPFCGVSETFGSSPNYCMVNENQDIPLNEDYELVGSPDWCPLSIGPILVVKTD